MVRIDVCSNQAMWASHSLSQTSKCFKNINFTTLLEATMLLIQLVGCGTSPPVQDWANGFIMPLAAPAQPRGSEQTQPWSKHRAQFPPEHT